tara:strand:- start:33 stop:194 length:162 start_codon:yes stop_codon:yes gene_type:complete
MKTPEIYKEVDTRELSLTDGDVLREHLLVLGACRTGRGAVCPRLTNWRADGEQ